MTNKYKNILKEIISILESNTLLNISLNDLDDNAKVILWVLFDFIENKLIVPRKKELREYLLQLAELKGMRKNNTFTYNVFNDINVQAQHKKPKTIYDINKLSSILENKNIPQDAVVKSVLKVDEKALEGLFAAKLITNEDLVPAIISNKPIHALSVTKPKNILSLLMKLQSYCE